MAMPRQSVAGRPDMDTSWLAFIELFVVFAFAIGRGVLELMLLRRDRTRAREKAGRASPGAAQSDSGSSSAS
jgi:hypothetical protein